MKYAILIAFLLSLVVSNVGNAQTEPTEQSEQMEQPAEAAAPEETCTLEQALSRSKVQIPKDLPLFPPVTMTVEKGETVDEPINGCTVHTVNETQQFSLREYGWALFSTFARTVFGPSQELDPTEANDASRYMAEVNFITLPMPWWAQGFHWSDDYYDKLVAWAKDIVEDEATLNWTAERIVPKVGILLGEEAAETLKVWLPDFWMASHADLSALEKAIHDDEGRYDFPAEAGGTMYLSGYLIDNNKKLDGWFMRRWMNKGRGQTGQDALVQHRFWMAKLAQVLGMPQAASWTTAVEKELKGTKTLKFKSWYQKNLPPRK